MMVNRNKVLILTGFYFLSGFLNTPKPCKLGSEINYIDFKIK